MDFEKAFDFYVFVGLVDFHRSLVRFCRIFRGEFCSFHVGVPIVALRFFVGVLGSFVFMEEVFR